MHATTSAIRASLAAALLVVSAAALGAEIAILELGSEAIDLDSGAILEQSPDYTASSAGGDVRLAYNADRTPHAVIAPATEGVEIAFVANVGFDGVSAADVPNLVFSSGLVDAPLSDHDCVVIRTDQGTLFKIGNAIENGLSVTLNYAPL